MTTIGVLPDRRESDLRRWVVGPGPLNAGCWLRLWMRARSRLSPDEAGIGLDLINHCLTLSLRWIGVGSGMNGISNLPS